MMEKELEQRLRAEKATPTASSSTSASRTSPLGGIKRQSSQKKLIMGVVKRSNSRKDSDNSGGKERRDSENSGGKDGASPEPEAKKAKAEESPVAAKANPLGALAGLGDYSSSEEED